MKILWRQDQNARDENQREMIQNVLIRAKITDSLMPMVEAIIQEVGKEDARFLLLIAKAKNFDVEGLFLEQKRYSDILIEVDKDEGWYAMICFDTGVEGGFHFAKRLLRHMKIGFAQDIYMVALDIRCALCGSWKIVDTLVQLYQQAVQKRRKGEAVLHVLHDLPRKRRFGFKE